MSPLLCMFCPKPLPLRPSANSPTQCSQGATTCVTLPPQAAGAASYQHRYTSHHLTNLLHLMRTAAPTHHSTQHVLATVYTHSCHQSWRRVLLHTHAAGDTGHRLRSSVTGELLTGSLRRAASHNNPSARSSHDVVAPVLREGGADGTPPPPPASNVAPAATGDAGGEGGHELEETAAFMGWSAFYM